MRLSQAMIRALRACQYSGHGYGDGAYLSVATARALECRGLVADPGRMVYRNGRPRLIGWLVLTDAGRAALDQLKAEEDARYFAVVARLDAIKEGG